MGSAITTTSIKDNNIGRDVAGRDINNVIHVARQPTPMAQLVNNYLTEAQQDKCLTEWTEKLQHYMSNQTSVDIRSLEEKLVSSGRDDLIRVALLRKQSAAKAILRQQSSKAAQAIYTFLMADMVVNFEQSVVPLLQKGAAREVVDEAMLEKVIAPAFSMLEENPLMLDKMDIQSLMYFLAGNCHIRWDTC